MSNILQKITLPTRSFILVIDSTKRNVIQVFLTQPCKRYSVALQNLGWVAN